jgi:uncharacterized DUF497 family protein
MSENTLYHYTTIDTLEKILSSKMFRFGSNLTSNDVMERYLTFIANDESDKKNIDKLCDIYFNKIKFACFSIDRYIEDDKIEGYKLERMWAQYAAKNTGVCICFDKKKIIDILSHKKNKGEIDCFYEKPVDYKDSLPDIVPPKGNYMNGDEETVPQIAVKKAPDDPLKHLHDYKDYYFFAKHLDWRDESEYRIVCFCKNTKKVEIPIEDITKQIILGVNFTGCFYRLKKRCGNIRLRMLAYQNDRLCTFPVEPGKPCHTEAQLLEGDPP